MPTTTPPRAVGIDDWALHKGTRYCSIVVDLDAHRVAEVLPNRSAPTVAAWLARHPSVTIITRYRSPEYARAANLCAPHAQQIADRWHLLHNAKQTAERWLKGIHARLRSLPVPEVAPVDENHGATRDRPFGRMQAEAAARVPREGLRGHAPAGAALAEPAAPCASPLDATRAARERLDAA